MSGSAAAIVDREYMNRALRLAARGRYTTTPNPRVGCVLVQGGRVIAEGWHRRAGGPHAEIDAIQRATEAVRGATAYVSLEPCSHQGRTPPCAEALIAAGVQRVVYAMEDPNPQVAGRGAEQLRQAGITVAGGLLADQARELNRGFVSRMQRGRPFVFAKLAASLDGRTAMASGESQWITGAPARQQVQQMRASSCAILTGVGTVLQDDPALTVRPEQLGACYPDGEVRQPLRVVVDSRLRTPIDARVLRQPGEAFIATLAQASPGESPLPATAFTAAGDRVDPAALLQWLASERGCNEVMVESGPVLAGALLRAGLLDELHLFMAPTLLGSSARPLLELPLAQMDQQQRLSIQDMRRVGDDLWIRARPVAPGGAAGGKTI